MQTQRKGSDLKIQIRMALASLGRDFSSATKGKSIADMLAMLGGLRREQIERGIIKRAN